MLYVSGLTYSLKSIPNYRCFEKLFMVILFTLRVFTTLWTKIRSIDCNGLSLLIFEEKLPNYTSGPKSAPNSDSFWKRRLFNVCVRVFCVPNATILLIYIPVQIKMSFIWKDGFFFFLLKSASSVDRRPILQNVYTTIFVRWRDKTNYLTNQSWAKCYLSRNKH